MNLYNPGLKNRDWVLSARHQVANSEQSLINRPRYTICSKCHKPVIKMIAQGYQRGHQNIPIGYFCRYCKVLYCEDKITFVAYKITESSSRSES